ncbi:MAG: outer membrane lipoprotein-sorting protein [Treponema sp.]|nr:outer membrane lipoprotein-sorting protein [Treponema sp.]
MKKIKTFIIAVSAFMACSLSFAVTDSQAADLLKKAEAGTGYFGTDFKADYVMVEDRPGQGKSVTTATMFRRDSKTMYTILITGPEADKGKGYVKFDNNIWFFDPKDKQFTYTSARSRFQNTNLTNSDLSPQTYSNDYKIESHKEVKLGKYDCVLLELSAVKKNLDYAKIKLWVSAADGLIRKREDYSLSGQLLRTTAIPSYQKVGSRFVPAGMLIVDNLKGSKIDGKMQYEKTQVTVSNVSFQKQGDIVYSKAYLENMSDQ